MKRFLIAVLSIAGFCQVLSAGPTQYYGKPTYRNDRLDWCKDFAKGCGKPAADKFCQFKGHKAATTFAIDANIGRTRLITGPVCEDSFCDGFKYIYCKKKYEVVRKPRYRDYPRDWCKNFARDCGKPAADAYCKKRGWSKSYAHKIWPNIGKTRLITGAVCEDNFCDGFEYIGCN